MSKPAVVQLVITTTLAIAFGTFVGATSFYHFRSYDHAFTQYIHNRTAENKAIFDSEAEKIRTMRLKESLKGGVLFFLLLNFAWSLLRRRLVVSAVCVFLASSAFQLLVGIPSFPLEWRCCTYWGPGFDEGISETAVQLSACFAWLISAFFLTISLWFGLSRKKRSNPVES